MEQDSPNYNLIEEYLYLGDIGVAENIELLKKLNIKRVLSLINDEPLENIDPQITYKWCDIVDSETQDILSILPDCCQFILDGQQIKENIYIHCHAGISRSGAIVTGFLMKKYNLCCYDAIKKVREIRDISPNDGFKEQLILFREMNYETNVMYKPYRWLLFFNILKKWWHIDWPDCSKAPLRRSLDRNFNFYFEKFKNSNIVSSTYHCIQCQTILFQIQLGRRQCE